MAGTRKWTTWCGGAALLLLALSCSEPGEGSLSGFDGAKGEVECARCGSLTDTRDGNVYRTAEIGGRTWLAENLRFETDSSACYEGKKSNCAAFGRLYSWADAMGLSAKHNNLPLADGISNPHRGVCPEGWHVPTNGEWNDLHAHVSLAWPWNRSQQLLKSFDWGGIDLFGFGARPTGYRYAAGDFLNADSTAAWWTASESTIGTDAYYRRFSAETEENEPAYYGYFKSYGRALRCAKDPEG